ncbi:uncharacterized protein LOC133932931 [Platichthys flesus]|uniref:uncharacterized protein LOC133932931 n=1 Tax=Platichthys flesus TaxID=8260 RepID=UPI002DB5F1E6|nr:uncharacterized protein LOC133932931 [Platichthys flesus]
MTGLVVISFSPQMFFLSPTNEDVNVLPSALWYKAAQSKPSLKKMWGRIKTCAAKQFAQVSLCHIVERLNKKNFDSPDNPAFDKVLSRQSMQAVMSDIDTLLPTAVGEIQRGQNVSQWMDDIFSGNTLELTNELKNILINHIDRMRPKITSRPKASQPKASQSLRTSITVCPPPAIISADILGIVWCFLGVLRWWLHTQSETLTSRVITQTLEKAVSDRWGQSAFSSSSRVWLRKRADVS